LFELYDAGQRTFWMMTGDNASKGRIFRFDSSRDPIRIADTVGPAYTAAIEFAFHNADLYSCIQYGSNLIISDHGEHTPYFADYNDTTLVKLLNSGTEFKARYLELFQRRIILAYTDQTNGDIEIRWSEALPTPGSMAIVAGNQLFIPDDDSITGIKKFGQNACFLYSENSISSIDYYPNYLIPFAIRNMVTGNGCAGHHSIINTGGAHYFLNKNYGFVDYRGGTQFPASGKPISYDIEDLVATINPNYYNTVVGSFIQNKNTLVWTVPLNGVSTPSHLLYYYIPEQKWFIENVPTRYISNWTSSDALIWNNLAGRGFTYWSDFGTSAFTDYITTNQSMMISDTDGFVYSKSGESDNLLDFDGYRVEPVMNFSGDGAFSLLNEIWFNFVEHGVFDLYCQYRGGDTLQECLGSVWESLNNVSHNDPQNSVIYTNKNNRWHQIKWGTGKKNERFGVSAIEFKFVPQGKY
jgi:ABC-type molybdate transport system substrate-binding protein